MTITLRAGALNSGIQQNGTEFLTVDTSNNATLSNNLTVTGGATLGAGAVLGTPTSGNLANCTGYPASGLVGGALTSGTAVATTSGTSIDFTSIPSWVKRITVMFNGVSTNGTSVVLMQIGTSGGVEVSGYLGSCSTILGTAPGANNFTTGWGVGADNIAASVKHGFLTIALLNTSSNLWACSGVVGASNEARASHTGGTKPLAATLDRVRITTVNGTDTFDAGSINILYE